MNRRVALEIFYIFVCIVLLWSLAYLACQCMCFLHEANVAVDFSFSSLSLCDIVYWEKKMWTSFCFVFDFKRGYCDTVWYCHLSWLSVLILTPEKLWLLFYTLFFSKPFWRQRACKCETCWSYHLCWGSPRGTVIHTTQEVSLDQSISASRLHTPHCLSFGLVSLCVHLSVCE